MTIIPSGDDPRALGPTDRLLYFIDRVLRRLTGSRCRIHRYWFVVQPMDIEIRLPRRLGENMVARIIGPDDPESVAFPRPPETIRSRYRQRSTCLALYKESAFVGFIWLCPNEYQEDEVRCRFQPRPASHVIWDYDLFLMPQYRSGVAFLKLWAATMEKLRTTGIKWSASRISAFTPRSLTSHRRLGATPVGQALFLVFFRLQLTIATVPPYLHFASGSSIGPIIVVQPPSTSPE